MKLVCLRKGANTWPRPSNHCCLVDRYVKSIVWFCLRWRYLSAGLKPTIIQLDPSPSLLTSESTPPKICLNFTPTFWLCCVLLGEVLKGSYLLRKTNCFIDEVPSQSSKIWPIRMKCQLWYGVAGWLNSAQPIRWHGVACGWWRRIWLSNYALITCRCVGSDCCVVTSAANFSCWCCIKFVLLLLAEFKQMVKWASSTAKRDDESSLRCWRWASFCNFSRSFLHFW